MTDCCERRRASNDVVLGGARVHTCSAENKRLLDPNTRRRRGATRDYAIQLLCVVENLRYLFLILSPRRREFECLDAFSFAKFSSTVSRSSRSAHRSWRVFKSSFSFGHERWWRFFATGLAVRIFHAIFLPSFHSDVWYERLMSYVRIDVT